jgi:hypothetical protein
MRTSFRTICAGLAVSLCCNIAAFAARNERPRLTLADNKVTVAGRPAASGISIAPGDTIVTGRRSHAELTLPDGTVVRIGQGSSFTYTGSKLVLNQGTALVRIAHKGTTVVSGSRTYTGGPAVVSAQASSGNDGLYVLHGSGKVNGAPLIAGQTSVLDHGKDRTFTFDLQKLVTTSALVTKFPQSPWVVQTQALASVQHQLLTAKITTAAQSQKAAAGGTASSASHAIVSSSLANRVSTGAAGTSLAGKPGSLQFTGSPISLGANSTAVIKSAAISPATNGGTLQLVGSVITTGGATVMSTSSVAGSNTATGTLTINPGAITSTGALTKTGAATLDLNGGTLNTGATVSTGASGAIAAINTSNFVLNTSLPAITTGGTTTIAGGNNTLTAVGTNVAVANTTLTFVGTGGLIDGANTLRTASLSSIPTGGTLNYQPGNNVVIGGVTLPQQAGQAVTVNGINYITQPGIVGGTLSLQQVTH